MEKLKTGIVGTGKVAHLHAAALAELEESDFTAVCNVNFESARAFAEQYGVEPYRSVAEMVEDGGVRAQAAVEAKRRVGEDRRPLGAQV